jgi:hypothetical protein
MRCVETLLAYVLMEHRAEEGRGESEAVDEATGSVSGACG